MYPAWRNDRRSGDRSARRRHDAENRGRHQELRRRRGLGIREVAQRSGVSHASISLIERDKISPSLDTLAAVLDALGTTIVGFFSNSRLLVAESPFYTPEDLPEIGNPNAISYRMIGAVSPIGPCS